VLKLRRSIITAAADAAAGRERGSSRQLRSELPFISAGFCLQPVRDERDLLRRGAMRDTGGP